MIRVLLQNVIRTGVSAVNKFHVSAAASLQPPALCKGQQLRELTSTLRYSHFMSNSIAPINMPSTVPVQSQIRTVTKFSLIKGKRKSVKAVIKRFKRLDWGIWIRTHSGRHKKLFKKSPALKRRLRQHIFTNATQSWLLDKMVTNFWRRPKHYIDDPYAPYHRRDEFYATASKTFKV